MKPIVLPVLSLLLLAGCEMMEPLTPAPQGTGTTSTEPTRQGGRQTTPVASDGWPFRPASLRVHPLSRLVQAPGGDFVEVRIEFVDQWGATAKGFGTLTVDLYAAPSEGAALEVQARWQRDLRDLELNAQHYEDVTRTYLFKLSVDPSDLRTAAEVVCFYKGDDGSEFQASHILRLD